MTGPTPVVADAVGRPLADPALQLAAEFAANAGADEITDALRAARADLAGQIVPEALDEMAYRLAHYRLAATVR